MLNTTSDHKFDVMFIEFMTLASCFLPLAEKLNIPVIGTVTLRSAYIADMIIGNSNILSVVPNELSPFNDNMTFYQRFVNSLYYVYLEYCRRYVIASKLDRIFRQYYSAELWYKKNVSLLFVNNHATIFPRALVPNIIEVGGIHVKPAKPLPKVIISAVSSAEAVSHNER